MGLLSEGSPLSWAETKTHAEHVRRHGIKQFIHLYHQLKDRSNDDLKWGDEVEYMLLKLDKANKTGRLLLNAGPILTQLQELELSSPPGSVPTLWRPEYAAYMIEGTPGIPYGSTLAHCNMVESNMRLRREEVQKLLGEGEVALSLTMFPRLGCPPFTEPPAFPTPNEGAARSLFFPDEATFGGHPRFKTLTRNIRQRRGMNQDINVPVYKDSKTPSPYLDDFQALGDASREKSAKEDHVYLDCMGFGMGLSCLQMTFQACNIREARFLYDQLAPLCPIFLALSAACPILRGHLVDTDCRWNVIAGSVDDRTLGERGLEPLKEGEQRIPKSRYDSIDSYLSPSGEPFNDVPLVKNEEYYEEMIKAGIDGPLAQHIAHLFIRDPISLFSEKVSMTDVTDTDHFENIQSTNWQTMRFKPPPADSPIGWRVEFRPTEVQLTDFENAAFAVFVVLLTRVILTFNLCFVIPISKVDKNMKVAHKRDAVLKEKFFFRKDILTCDSPKEAEQVCGCSASTSSGDIHAVYDEFTIDEIINGKPDVFQGLVPLLRQFLDNLEDVDVDTSCTINQYLDLIQKRASGRLKTTAKWMREFVLNHPSYEHDSKVSEEINFDLLSTCEKITKGECFPPDLLTKHGTKTRHDIPTAI
ncbi:hypothetical protein CAPTEDRAFT_24669, partial [Capitella teleta]